MGVFRAYCDESKTHHTLSDRVYAAAGFIAYASDWVPFTERWLSALEPYGLTDFHMTEWENATPGTPYGEMTDKEAENLFNRLLDIVIDLKPYPFAADIEMSIWEHLNDGLKARLGGDPYIALNHLVCVGAPMCVQSSDNEVKVDFFFEYPPQKGFIEPCVNAFYNLKASHLPVSERLIDITFSPSSEHREFDAADILAHGMMNQRRKDIQQNPRTRYELRRIMETWGSFPIFRITGFGTGHIS